MYKVRNPEKRAKTMARWAESLDIKERTSAQWEQPSARKAEIPAKASGQWAHMAKSTVRKADVNTEWFAAPPVYRLWDTTKISNRANVSLHASTNWMTMKTGFRISDTLPLSATSPHAMHLVWTKTLKRLFHYAILDCSKDIHRMPLDPRHSKVLQQALHFTLHKRMQAFLSPVTDWVVKLELFTRNLYVRLDMYSQTLDISHRKSGPRTASHSLYEPDAILIAILHSGY